ncbi:MAG: hypothetical protein JWM98_3420 [Thermoleophilia bacterium]|nr:hypothetical protein [Thermoleophilia bacterium]
MPSTDEQLESLVAMAVGSDPETDEFFELSDQLRTALGPGLVDSATQLVAPGRSVRERTVGVELLGGPSPVERHVGAEASRRVDAILGALEGAQDAHLVIASVSALGHCEDPRVLPTLWDFRDHPSEEVRNLLTFAAGGRPDDQAVELLLTLTRDASSWVRDWATHFLSYPATGDTPEIRTALLDRLSDDDREVRLEAMGGLTERRDMRALEPVLEEVLSLKNGAESFPGDALASSIDDLEVILLGWDMAAASGDPRFAAFLEAERKRAVAQGEIPDRLRAAIRSVLGDERVELEGPR